MGILDGLMGNASRTDPGKAQADFQRLLAEGERIEHAYQLIRDHLLFTDRRLILVDRQGITGSKTEYHSVPWRSITQFSIESAGTFDLDAELKVWVSGQQEPLARTFNRSLDIYAVQAVLARYVLGR